MDKKITTAVISRFMTIDLPYYSQWLEYYDKLGFDYFYLYYIDDNFEENLEKVLTYFPKQKIQIIQVDKNKIYPNAVFKKIKLDIKEDYVINIDSDEFLYLGGMNIQSFLKRFNNFNYFTFNWLMAPSLKKSNESLNEILKDRNSPKYFLTEYKSLTKTKFINFPGTQTPHDFIIKPMFQKKIKKFTSLNINKKLKTNFKNKFFLIHFCYRDMLDCFYKQLSQNLFLIKDQETNYFFNDKISFKLMPKRFLVYFGEILNTNPKIFQMNIDLNLTTKIDNNYLLNNLKHDLNQSFILDKYVERIHFLMEKFKKLKSFHQFKIKKSAKLELLRHFKRIKNFDIKFNDSFHLPTIHKTLKNNMNNSNSNIILSENTNINNDNIIEMNINNSNKIEFEFSEDDVHNIYDESLNYDEINNSLEELDIDNNHLDNNEENGIQNFNENNNFEKENEEDNNIEEEENNIKEEDNNDEVDKDNETQKLEDVDDEAHDLE